MLVDTVTGGQKPRRRRGADNAGWPAYVQREFYDYLQCGILAHGFLRLGCDTCHQEMLLPFSCNRSRRHGQPDLGLTVSAQTVGNVLKRHGIAPAPERKTTTTWKEFIRTHMDVLVATDFFTAEVWTLGGLVTCYILFFIHLGSWKVHIAGMTPHPTAAWMMQIARNITMEEWGFLSPGRYLIHDRDGKYCHAFQQIIDTAGVTRVPLPPRSPNLNAYAERWVRSVKEECLSRLILFGEASLRYALAQYVAHFHHERNHQGKGNVLLFPTVNQDGERAGPLQCRERLGGLLKYYTCEAA